MDYLNTLLQKWMPSQQRVAVDSIPTLHGIWDTINATLATDGPPTRLPLEFYDPKARSIIDRIVTEEEYSGYKESVEYRTVGIGAMLGDAVQRMVRSSRRKEMETGAASSGGGELDMKDDRGASGTGLKIALFGSHDSTIAATLASLGALEGEDNAWPSYTSSLAIELFRAIDPASSFSSNQQEDPPAPGTKPAENHPAHGSPRQYVRIRYNDRPITIPGCRPRGNHFDGDESMCTFVRFFFVLFLYTIIPLDETYQPTPIILFPFYSPPPHLLPSF